jgi:hypothetical protein
LNNRRQEAPIDQLPDSVFVEIFNFCLLDSDPTKPRLEHTRQWQRLTRVCQRWRKVVFGASHGPRRLDLRLSCSYRTPVRKNLVFWPDCLPLTVDYPGGRYLYGGSLAPNDEINILSALQHAPRVHRITVLATGSLLRKMAPILLKSFPALTHLDLTWDLDDFPESDTEGVPVIPERFLGGSAPRLQHLCLSDIAFLQLPTFLLSARNLVTLKVQQIPPNGYISPEAMVGGLAVLTKLTTLSISLCEDTTPFHPRGSHPASPVQAILPALTGFHYRGHSNYLEDFLAQIDTPQINRVRIEYFMRQQIQVPKLSRFIDRTENLKIYQFTHAEGTFNEDIYFELRRPQGERRLAHLSLKMLCQFGAPLDTKVPYLAHVLGQLVPRFPNVVYLSASGEKVRSKGVDSTKWLPLFRLFPAVKFLDLSGGVAAHIASALVDAAETVTDVFPALHSIGLDKGEGKDEEGCKKTV